MVGWAPITMYVQLSIWVIHFGGRFLFDIFWYRTSVFKEHCENFRSIVVMYLWWFHGFFIFTPSRANDPIWLGLKPPPSVVVLGFFATDMFTDFRFLQIFNYATPGSSPGDLPLAMGIPTRVWKASRCNDRSDSETPWNFGLDVSPVSFEIRNIGLESFRCFNGNYVVSYMLFSFVIQIGCNLRLRSASMFLKVHRFAWKKN